MPPPSSRWPTLTLGALSLAAAAALVALFHVEAARYGLDQRLLNYLVAPGLSEPEAALVVFQILYAVPGALLFVVALDSLGPRLVEPLARWHRAADPRVPLMGLTLFAMAASWLVRTFVTRRADFTDDERLYLVPSAGAARRRRRRAAAAGSGGLRLRVHRRHP